ncbi:3-oxoadipate enol-lactonase [Blastococcus haudaquaticus]|uniref:3-oxoadipate enol-lactonase n=1 Tax=Blastococcus haudaquaticus TaxID=1938745 RepID=A0A286GT99_9ACTN|nr:3-oxoadipate enol-lactonase [Blastococcus haudaquaticus]SOD98426.1 3-oxoadipate enol-lactonase [Blastococcus haudaquaticus]
MTAVDVSYTEDGPADAPAVVLSNSLGATRAMWDAQVPALAERFRVITYDTRGHGESPVPDGPYALDDLVDDVVALLDRLGIERAHVAGLSLGGMTGMRLAAREPARVDRLVLLCTSALLGPRQNWLDRARTARTEGMAALAPVVVGRWFTPEFAAAEPATVARMQAMIASQPGEGYAGCCEAIADMDVRADLPAITAPTLVISGWQDPATPPEHQQAIVDAVPGAELLTVSPGAHLANVEQPLQVTGALLGHFDAAGGTA